MLMEKHLLEDLEECCVCMQNEQDIRLSCGHQFCKKCISTIIEKISSKNECPLCRNKFNVMDFVKSGQTKYIFKTTVSTCFLVISSYLIIIRPLVVSVFYYYYWIMNMFSVFINGTWQFPWYCINMSVHMTMFPNAERLQECTKFMKLSETLYNNVFYFNYWEYLSFFIFISYIWPKLYYICSILSKIRGVDISFLHVEAVGRSNREGEPNDDDEEGEMSDLNINPGEIEAALENIGIVEENIGDLFLEKIYHLLQ
eukprot:UN30301